MIFKTNIKLCHSLTTLIYLNLTNFTTLKRIFVSSRWKKQILVYLLFLKINLPFKKDFLLIISESFSNKLHLVCNILKMKKNQLIMISNWPTFFYFNKKVQLHWLILDLQNFKIRIIFLKLIITIMTMHLINSKDGLIEIDQQWPQNL